MQECFVIDKSLKDYEVVVLVFKLEYCYQHFTIKFLDKYFLLTIFPGRSPTRLEKAGSIPRLKTDLERESPRVFKNENKSQILSASARLAQSVERQTLNLKAVGSTPTLGAAQHEPIGSRFPVIGLPWYLMITSRKICVATFFSLLVYFVQDVALHGAHGKL